MRTKSKKPVGGVFSSQYWTILDTLAQNGLESAKFLITVPHYNFCIVHCDQGVCISYVADIVHFGKAVGQQQQQQVQQQICPSWTSVYQSDRLWFVQAAE